LHHYPGVDQPGLTAGLGQNREWYPIGTRQSMGISISSRAGQCVSTCTAILAGPGTGLRVIVHMHAHGNSINYAARQQSGVYSNCVYKIGLNTGQTTTSIGNINT
jgi:hypothetical protein